MVASVLSSPRAVEMSILAVRAFVPFRQILATNRQLAAKLDELDHKIAAHDKSIADHGTSIDAHRKGILSLYSAIENLMPTLTNRQIGFKGRIRRTAQRRHRQHGGEAISRAGHLAIDLSEAPGPVNDPALPARRPSGDAPGAVGDDEDGAAAQADGGDLVFATPGPGFLSPRRMGQHQPPVLLDGLVLMQERSGTVPKTRSPLSAWKTLNLISGSSSTANVAGRNPSGTASEPTCLNAWVFEQQAPGFKILAWRTLTSSSNSVCVCPTIRTSAWACSRR